MKKTILFALPLVGLMLLLACEKEEVFKHQDFSGSASTNVEKSLNINLSATSGDPYLILAIQGLVPAYHDIDILEEFLIDNAPLSTAVLTALINSPRFSDEMVEELTIISAPVGQPIKTLLSIARPSLSQFAINQTNDVTIGQKFIVVNTNPKAVIIASTLSRKSTPNGECSTCTSTIIASADNRLINLTNSDLDPLAIGGGCPGGKICGSASILSKSGNVYTVFCLNNTLSICINAGSAGI